MMGGVSPETCWASYKLLLLPLALQPAVGFGLSNNTSLIYHHLSPLSHSQHFKISFYFFSPSFPGSSSSSRPFQFLSEEFLGILSSSILSSWRSQLILCPFIFLIALVPIFALVCYKLTIFLRSSYYPEHGGSRFIRTIVTSVPNYRGFLINLFIWQRQVLL